MAALQGYNGPYPSGFAISYPAAPGAVMSRLRLKPFSACGGFSLQAQFPALSPSMPFGYIIAF